MHRCVFASELDAAARSPSSPQGGEKNGREPAAAAVGAGVVAILKQTKR